MKITLFPMIIDITKKNQKQINTNYRAIKEHKPNWERHNLEDKLTYN